MGCVNLAIFCISIALGGVIGIRCLPIALNSVAATLAVLAIALIGLLITVVSGRWWMESKQPLAMALLCLGGMLSGTIVCPGLVAMLKLIALSSPSQ
jgi:hypothetical protein